MITRLAAASGMFALMLGASASPVTAQDYPNRPLHVFIGFPAGSGADILGRY